MPVQNRDYYGASQRGRQDRLNNEFDKTRNALGQLELQELQRFNALATDPNATPEQFARSGRTGIGTANALTGLNNNNLARQKVDAERMFAAAQWALKSQSPKQFIAQNFPDIAALNPNFANETDEQVAMSLQDLIGRFGAQAGIGPPPTPVQYEQVQGPRGSVLQRDPVTGELKQVVGPDNSQPVAPTTKRFRPMSVKEIQAAGLAPGTAAQVNDETGQIQVLSKPSASAVLSPKDAATAKQKLVTINLARQQLQNIQQRFNEIKGSMVAGGGGQGKLPTPKGQAFDRAVDQMRSTLTALTKVPGIGAMSDYETRLDQAKFPNRADYENVTQQQIDDLKMLVQTMEEGYKGLLNGEMPAQQEQAEPDLSQLSDEDLLRALSGG